MNLTKRTVPVDIKTLIEERLSEYDIYRYYIGNEIKLNTMIRSPLHKDKHPSFSVGASSSGRLIWRDYSMDMKGGWTDLVAEMYKLSYPEVLKKVARDFMLLEGKDEHKKIIQQYKQPVIEPKRTLIQVSTRKFSSEDIKWWGKYLITPDDLKKEEVYAVESYYINRQKQSIKPGEKVYAYYYGEHGMKIYRPDRTKDEGRWKSSIPCSYVENLQNLNGDKRVLITKSKKDRICLQKIVPYPVLNVQNEGKSGYTEEFRKLLEGRQVIINYDADDAGVRNCKTICDTWSYNYVNTPKHLLPEVKDISDWIKSTGSYKEPETFLKQKCVI